jgi:hypothetical protein
MWAKKKGRKSDRRCVFVCVSLRERERERERERGGGGIFPNKKTKTINMSFE